MSYIPPDPIYFVKEILTVVVIAGLLVGAWVYRRTILLAISGDDRVHLTCLDCLWFTLCRCCGCCSGDWTRYLTWCCPNPIRRTNLVVASGRWCGLTSYSVELKNMVVGDLPTKQRGDVFLAVTCKANPELVTSLAEDSLPKIVHFPESLTLKLRWSKLEQPVRIVVKALNVVGSTELCQCYLDPNDVLHWSSYEPMKVKRFEMKTSDPSYQVDTPPWIALQFSQPTEARHLDSFHGYTDTVREVVENGDLRDWNIRDFKKTYKLLDQTGSAIQEPLEDEIYSVQCLDFMCNTMYWATVTMLSIGILGCIIFRFYSWSCWNQFRIQKTAFLQNETFPVPLFRLNQLRKTCQQRFQGTGVDSGSTTCRPTPEQILDFCEVEHPQLQEKYGAPRPHALKMLVYQTTGLEIPGVPCFEGVCSVHMGVTRFDAVFAGIVVLLIAFTCCCRMLSVSMVTNQKHRQRKEREERRAHGDPPQRSRTPRHPR